MAKAGSCNPMQKGERRQMIHEKQNNVGDKKNDSEYKNFDGTEIKSGY